MAARTSKTELHEKWREKIQGSMLLNRLRDHVLGECELTPTQVRAAEILLRKVLPDLSAVDHSGSVEQVHSFAVPIDHPDTRSPEEWARQTVQ